ncbi:chorismate mutase [Celeribacter sp.]|uniref:chorismate mutase n=1 Tax=Celeribacter sp. TaxID=1890673 RepID=UPI003A9194B9
MTFKSPQEFDTMTDLRMQIDEIDRALVRLLALRQKHIDRAAEIKPAAGLPARIESRVEDVVAKVRAAAEVEGFEPETAAAMWRLMIESMIAREDRAMTTTPQPNQGAKT